MNVMSTPNPVEQQPGASFEIDFFQSDIREQFPINRSITPAIAVNQGIPHPCYLETRALAPMTVDFLVTRVRNGERYLQAFSAKRDGESE